MPAIKDMGEDYLWDKNGSDAEIEDLERLLSEFRADVSAVPALPVAAAEAQSAPPAAGWSGVFGWLSAPRLAWGAVLPLLAMSALIWFQLKPAVQPATADTVTEIVAVRETTVTQVENRVETAKPPQGIDGVTVREVKMLRKSSVQSPAPVPRRVLPKRAVPAGTPDEEFSAEERRAYDQLILALSVTGSKLKIVKDAVQGERSASVSAAK
jgi:hypothetical protein